MLLKGQWTKIIQPHQHKQSRKILPDDELHLCEAVPPDPGGGDHPELEPAGTPGPHPLLLPPPETTDWKLKSLKLIKRS